MPVKDRAMPENEKPPAYAGGYFFMTKYNKCRIKD